MRACFFGLLLLVLPPPAGAAVSIGDELYTVNVEPVDGGFTLASKPSGKIFLSGGKLGGTGGRAAAVDVTDKALGKGSGTIRTASPCAPPVRWSKLV